MYLVREFAEHEDGFFPIKDQSQLIVDVKKLSGLLPRIPAGVAMEEYTIAPV